MTRSKATQSMAGQATPPPSPPSGRTEKKPALNAVPDTAMEYASRPIAASAPTPDPGQLRGPHVSRGRAYSFVLDDHGLPIELGSGRSGKAFLGEERWLESTTAFRRNVAIKMLQRGVSPEDALRFQMEKELLERVQGHPNIIGLFASGGADNPDFIPKHVDDKVENDFMVLELCDLSLEDRLKGTRGGEREDLLQLEVRDRLFRVLEYMLPIASAVEYAHLECNVCHRDIKPGNILLRLPNPKLRGSTLDVRLADFNVGKVWDHVQELSVTGFAGVPGTLFFQAPEQETNIFEVLVNVERGSDEVSFFEDFYLAISQNDCFQLFNRGEQYQIKSADLRRKKLLLSRPYAENSERNVRAKILKSVDRPADIYSLGALFYYLISGAYGNPKSLYDAFHNFIEYDGHGESGETQNTIEAYIDHEYSVIHSLRTPRVDEHNQPVLAPADRFFSYKHYLDGNGELIDKEILKVIAKSMIRNKTDSYCQAWDVSSTGISDFVNDIQRLYGGFGTYMPSRPGHLVRKELPRKGGWQSLWMRARDAVKRDRPAPKPPAQAKKKTSSN